MIKFQKLDFDPKKIFFSSDFHYGHKNISQETSWDKVKNEGKIRPWDVTAMNDYIIDEINSKVPYDGLLIHNGDWSFGGYEKAIELRSNIICENVINLIGNHDHNILAKRDLMDMFLMVDHILCLSIENQDIIFSHYPMLAWHKQNKGTWMLHGHCVDMETEILTNRGWLKRSELLKEDLCFSYNFEKEIAEYKSINNIIDMTYSGVMYSHDSKFVNFRTTDNHRHLLFEGKKYEFVLSKDIDKQQKFIRVSAYNPFNKGVDITDDMLRLLIWINADGSFENKTLVRFHLKKERKIAYLKQLLDKLKIKYSENYSRIGNVKINFQLPEELKSYSFKPLDSILINCNAKQTTIIFQEYENTDGYRTYTNSLQIYSCKEAEIDLLQNIAIQRGFRCNKIVRNRGKHIGWILSVNFGKDYQLTNFKDNIIKENVVNEDVWCIQTEYENFLIRRNGKCHFTGNCHGNLKDNPELKLLDIGFDTFLYGHNQYSLYSFDELQMIMEQKQFKPVDHHE